MEADSVRWLRLASARLTDASLAQPGRDLLLRAPHGGTICLCWQGSRFETGDPRSLDLVRHDDDHRELSRTTILQVDGFDPGDIRSPTQVALEPSPDGRFAYLARATRAGTGWQASLDVIDLGAEAITGSMDLIARTQARGMEVLRVERPTLRIAPDGRHALVTSAITRVTPFGERPFPPRAWIVELDGSSLSAVVDVDALAGPMDASCTWLDFVAPDIVARGCFPPASDEAAWFEIHRHGLDGSDLGSIVVPTSRLGADEPLLDLTNGIAYAWDPITHRLASADLVGGTGRMAATPDGFDAPSEVVILRERPAPGTPTTWSDGHSATIARRERTLVGSPDGRLLFAIGEGPDEDSSSGVWVFDALTLELVERWPAKASYGSLALLEDGRWLAAIGRPGSSRTPSLSWRPRRHCAAGRSAPSTSTSTWARSPALRHRRRRLGQQPRRGVLLQPRRQAPAGGLDQRAGPRGRPARRELDGPHDRQAPLRAARSSWSGPLAQHDARGVAARPRRPLRRRPARAAADAGEDLAGLGRGVPPGPRRGRRRPRCSRPAAEWETPRFNDSGFPKEDADTWHVRAFGEAADYDLLAASDPRRRGRTRTGSGHFAWRLWQSADRHRQRTGPGAREHADLRHHRRPRARHHPAGGERRHRQDVDHRRPRHQAHRLRRGPPRRDAGRHLHPRGQPGAARARAAASSTRPCSCSPTRACATRTTGSTTGCSTPTRRRPSGARPSLTAALVSFDAATIATIHQFCQLVLRSLGVAGDTDASAILVEDLEQLTTETVDDLYLARFGGEREAPVVTGRGPGAGAGRRR